MNKVFVMVSILIFSIVVPTEILAQKKSKKKNEVSKPSITQPIGPPTVARVINGDLLELSNGELVRLMGADAPVMPINGKIGQEPWSSQARNFVEQLTLGKEITINGLGLSSDEYGRKIGLVYVGELWLDYELIKEGLAVIQNNRYLDSKSKQMLIDAQSEALTFGRGIWQSDNKMPMPPKEFRAANGLSESDKPKDDSWKNIVPKSYTRKTPGNVNIGNGDVGDSNTSIDSRFAQVFDALEALKQIQGRANNDKGVGTNELGRLVAIADGKIQAITYKGDGLLNKSLREGLDAYKLVLDATKKREIAKDDERIKYSKFIEGALEIADQAIVEIEKRLAKLSK